MSQQSYSELHRLRRGLAAGNSSDRRTVGRKAQRWDYNPFRSQCYWKTSECHIYSQALGRELPCSYHYGLFAADQALLARRTTLGTRSQIASSNRCPRLTRLVLRATYQSVDDTAPADYPAGRCKSHGRCDLPPARTEPPVSTPRIHSASKHSGLTHSAKRYAAPLLHAQSDSGGRHGLREAEDKKSTKSVNLPAALLLRHPLSRQPRFHFLHRALRRHNSLIGGRFRPLRVGVGEEDAVHRLPHQGLHLRCRAPASTYKEDARGGKCALRSDPHSTPETASESRAARSPRSSACPISVSRYPRSSSFIGV